MQEEPKGGQAVAEQHTDPPGLNTAPGATDVPPGVGPFPHTEVKPEEFTLTSHGLANATKDVNTYHSLRVLADRAEREYAGSHDPKDLAKAERLHKQGAEFYQKKLDGFVKTVINPDTGAIRVPNAEPGVKVDDAIDVAKRAVANHGRQIEVSKGEYIDVESGKPVDDLAIKGHEAEVNRALTLDQVRANAPQSPSGQTHAHGVKAGHRGPAL